MRAWWRNGGVYLEPANDQERMALRLLFETARRVSDNPSSPEIRASAFWPDQSGVEEQIEPAAATAHRDNGGAVDV